MRRIEREWAGLIRPQTFPYEWNVCVAITTITVWVNY